ncbi:MAG: hypothetical protein ABIU09_09530, partial [Pyrinomonadaceae bacterium]
TTFKTYKYGNGSNWKLRTLRVGLENLGFNEEILSIGWKRAYYGCPLATNWREFLTGQDTAPFFMTESKEDLVEYWKARWLTPRQEKLSELLQASVL